MIRSSLNKTHDNDFTKSSHRGTGGDHNATNPEPSIQEGCEQIATISGRHVQ